MALRNINKRDPRFQRALMRAEAGGIQPRRGILSNIYRGFAGQELKNKLDFARIQESRDAFNARLGLAQRGLKWNKKLQSKKMRDLERERLFTIGGGLLSTGIATYLGNLQAKRQAELNRAEMNMYERMLGLFRNYKGLKEVSK